MKIIKYGIWVFLFLLSACGPDRSSSASTRSPTQSSTAVPATGASSLAGTRWMLVSFGPTGSEKNLVGQSTITLELSADGKAGGSGGCNNYGGTYQINGNSIKFSGLASTLMACADNQVTQQEGDYLKALDAAEQYSLTGNQLTIQYNSPDGQGVLQFTKAS